MGRLVYLDLRGMKKHDALSKAVTSIVRSYDVGEYIEKVKPIVKDVREKGYSAVKYYSEKFDGINFDNPKVSRDEMTAAWEHIDDDVRWALSVAAKRIAEFQKAIMPKPTTTANILLSWIPIERVGVYVPGGLRPYPSSLLMAAIPAKIAGAKVVAVTPPSRGEFKANPLVEAAALVADIDELYAVGGAQAIAGLAYGAAPLPKVDKIVGPGNPYVEAAKLLVSHETGIDMIAGPSEIAVVADETADPKVISLDLLAQAEHGALSLAVLLTPSARVAEAVAQNVRAPLSGEHMGSIYIAVVDSVDVAADIVNAIAPEHLEVMMLDYKPLLTHIRNAGLITVNTPIAYTDYAAGPSHVLPTSGAARWRGGLSVYDFLKPTAVVSGTDDEALTAAVILAEAEGFKYHALSLEVRRRW